MNKYLISYVYYNGDMNIIHIAEDSNYSPPDLDRRVDSPALSGRGSRPSGRTSG